LSREVKEYFDNVSTSWDALRQGFYGDEVREIVLKAAEITKHDTVLDIGAGTGFLTEGAAKIARKVIAVDLSESMTQKALSKVSNQKNVMFKIGDAENIPVEDSTVNVVIGNMILHHCPRPIVAITEMVRVLKPKGRLVLSDLTEHKYESLRKEHADLWLGFPISKVQQMFQLAALSNVTVELLGSCCTSSTNENSQIKIPMFLAKGMKLF
jgi:ubiquinone/menaquinone biosynthesis C-methylase UbiE